MMVTDTVFVVWELAEGVLETDWNAFGELFTRCETVFDISQ